MQDLEWKTSEMSSTHKGKACAGDCIHNYIELEFVIFCVQAVLIKGSIRITEAQVLSRVSKAVTFFIVPTYTLVVKTVEIIFKSIFQKQHSVPRNVMRFNIAVLFFKINVCVM